MGQSANIGALPAASGDSGLSAGAAKLQAAALQVLGRTPDASLPRGYQPERKEDLPPASALGPFFAEQHLDPAAANADHNHWQQQQQQQPALANAEYDQWHMPRAESWEAARLPLPDMHGGAMPSSPSKQSVGDMHGGTAYAGSTPPSSPSYPSGGVEIGDLMEAYSGSAAAWFVARVVEVVPGDHGEILTVYFPTPDGAKQKSLHIHDSQLAPLGTNLNDALPPGFFSVPSQSRPGHMAFFDPAQSHKFGCQDLAWKSYFDHLLGPAPNSRTCPQHAALPPASAAMQHHTPSSAAPPMPGGMVPRPPPAEMEARNSASSHAALPVLPGAACPVPRPPPAVEGPRTEAPPPRPKANIALRRDDAGRVSLPSFGQPGQSSQASYLGSLGMGVALAEVYKPEPTPEPEYAQENDQPHAQVNYMPPSPQNCMAAPQNCMPYSPPKKPPVQAVDPTMEAWRADPFSEWRR